MALKFLIDLLSGNLVLVNIPSGIPPVEDMFLFIDTTEFDYTDATNIDFIT